MTTASASPWFFAWVEPDETTFGVEHQVWQEQIRSAVVEHTAGEAPRLSVEMVNPRHGLLRSDGRSHAWLSFDTGDTGLGVVPIFFGRVIAIPNDLFQELITVVFTAEPADFNFQKRLVAQQLRAGPSYDEIFLDVSRRDDPDAALEGYSVEWHIDRVTNAVTVSDLIEPEDGVEEFFESEIPYESVSVEFGDRPKSSVTIDSTVSWSQQSAGLMDLISVGLASYGGDGLMSEWPQPGASLGGGWYVHTSIAFDVLGLDKALTGSASVSWQNKSKRHANGDTMSVSQSVTEPEDKVKRASLSRVIYTKVQTGVLDPFAVDEDGDPSPLNIPQSIETRTLYVPLWKVGGHLTARYEGERERTERIIIKVRSDLQPVITDIPRNEQTELINVSGADVGIPIVRPRDWLLVRNSAVSVGEIILPEYPDFPGVRIAQVVTTAGTTGSDEPEFDPIEGGTTVDGSAVWTSLGEVTPDQTPPDWTASTLVPTGHVIAPKRQSIVPTYAELARPGLFQFPQKGVAVAEGTIIKSSNGSYHVATVAGDTAFRGAPRGWVPNNPIVLFYAVAPEPAFSTTWGATLVDGSVTWFCLGSTLPDGLSYFIATVGGETGEQLPPFDPTVGAVTTDGSVEWTCYARGEIPIGGEPGNTGRSSYFSTARGRQSIEYLIGIARAYLKNKSRAVKIKFQVPFLRALDLSCRKSATIHYDRLPGGIATGKIVEYTIEGHGGGEGRRFGTVTILCPIGQGGAAVEIPGTPVYCSTDYAGADYQQFIGRQILIPGGEDLTYAPPVADAIDDGLTFPLDRAQAVRASVFNASLDAQREAIEAAFAAAAEAAQLSEVQATSVAESIEMQRKAAAKNELTVEKAIQSAPAWFELTLAPVTGGPFHAVYSLETSNLVIPKLIDLEQ